MGQSPKANKDGNLEGPQTKMEPPLNIPLVAQSPQKTQPEVLIIKMSRNVTSFLYLRGRVDAS